MKQSITDFSHFSIICYSFLSNKNVLVRQCKIVIFFLIKNVLILSSTVTLAFCSKMKILRENNDDPLRHLLV